MGVVNLMRKTLSLVLMIVLFLGRASSSELIINGCNGSMNQSCLIGEDQEMELLMDSHTNRMLLELDPAKAITSKTGIQINPVVTCDRYKPYGSCLPESNQQKHPENNGIYNRVRHM
ncbi:hypothetical protein ACOSQ2_028429 [Xanthoceras sorbifolium]